jgi:hypothetical protein
MDFGLVTLDIAAARETDAGIFTCVATNAAGSATTSGTLKVNAESGVVSATQHPAGQAGLDSIQKADTGAALKLAPAGDAEEPVTGMKPVFTVNLPAEVTVGDDCKLHLECNVEPTKDSGLKIAWYHNGLPLSSGSRIRANHDFGHVTLDIADVGARDQVCISVTKYTYLTRIESCQ